MIILIERLSDNLTFESAMSSFSARFFPEDNFCLAVSTIDEIIVGSKTNFRVPEIFNNESWKPGMKLLIDCRSINSVQNSGFDEAFPVVSKVDEDIKARIGNGKKAYVCSSDFVYGVFRQWNRMRDSEKLILICRTFPEALKWLGIKDGEKFGIE